MKQGACIGIDPGIDGAVVIISQTGTVTCHDCPDTITEMAKILEYFRGQPCVKVLLEEVPKVIRRPATPVERRGGLKVIVVPATELRKNYGEWRGIMAALQIPWIEQSPRTWQKVVDGPKKKPIKDRVFDMASRLYPKARLRGPKGGKKYGRSDALIMADVLRRDGG